MQGKLANQGAWRSREKSQRLVKADRACTSMVYWVTGEWFVLHAEECAKLPLLCNNVLSFRQAGLSGGGIMYFSRYPFVCPFVCLSVRLFVCYQNCQHDILKTNEPILMQIGASGPRGKTWNGQFGGHEVRSKVKVTQGRR